MSIESKLAKFVADMEAAGFDVQDYYRGRNFDRRPAVIIVREQLQDVIRATSIRLQLDQMGRDGLIVYPA